MLHLLHNLHTNKSASIVASGPSAKKYNGSTDISIGVNGAAFLGKKFDYFLCGDNNAHKYSWFKEKCSDVRVISRLVASMDYQLYPEDFDIVRRSVPQHKQRLVQDLMCPVYPHIIFNYRWYGLGRLGKKDRLVLPNYLMFSGTISCCAVQLAYLMGCSEVHLYGCGFTGRRKKHYFYNNNEKVGNIVKSQFETMQKCLKEVRSLGMKVYIHGKSKLTEADKKYR